MPQCDKPISDLTLGEAATCFWEVIKGAFVAVFTHPGSATMTEWIVTVFTILTALYILTLLFFRR